MPGPTASSMTNLASLTDRDLELIDVALDSAANSVQAGATLRNRRGLDPLAAEYLTALEHVRAAKRVRVADVPAHAGDGSVSP